MGLGKTLLLGDLGNYLNIAEAEREIAELRRDLAIGFRRDKSLKEMVSNLIDQNNQMRLYFVSLVRLLTRKGTISREELLAMVAAIDAEDGCVDGKYTGSAVYPKNPAVARKKTAKRKR